MRDMYTTPQIALAAAALGLVVAGPAFAGGPLLTGWIAEGGDAKSSFANPAAMTRLQGTNYTLQTSLAHPIGEFKVDKERTTVDGGDPNADSEFMAIPAFFYVRELGENWRAGFSVTAPAGFGSTYGPDWSGRYYADDFSLTYIAFTPALAYRLSESLSFGVGVGINYTAESSVTRINVPLYEPDAKAISELDGIGINVTLSMLYEFSPVTRFGIAYTSDSDADLEGKLKLRKLPPELDSIFYETGLNKIDVDITNTLPQRVMAGIYHEFPSGKFFTVDGMWMKFSDFSIHDVEVDGLDLGISSPHIYDSIWAVSVGMGFPASSCLTYRVGVLYLSQPVDDDDRGLSIKLDRTWGVGAGFSYELDSRRSVDTSLSVLDYGEAPVDTGEDHPLKGRVAGKTDDPYALILDFNYHF